MHVCERHWQPLSGAILSGKSTKRYLVAHVYVRSEGASGSTIHYSPYFLELELLPKAR